MCNENDDHNDFAGEDYGKEHSDRKVEIELDHIYGKNHIYQQEILHL